MNSKLLLFNLVKSRSSLINHQTIRWRRVRKPFWVGIAKRKMFEIPQRFKKYSEEEFQEFIRLQRDYDAHRNSLLKFIMQDDPRRLYFDEKLSEDLETQIKESMEKNDLWNAECARIREERLKEGTEAKLNNILQEVESHQKHEKEVMKRVEEVVKIEKALSKSYITPENIDEVIDRCLKNVVEYDFAIDRKGNKFYGRETLDKRANKNEQFESEAAG